MSECITPILLGIPYNTVEGYHNLWGILYSDTTYKSRHHEVFASLTRPLVYPIISDDATSVVLYLSNTVRKSLRHHFNLRKATGRGRFAFIVDDVKDSCICELRHAKIIYTKVTNKEPMDHPQLCCYIIHTLNVVDLISEMLTYYGDASRVPGYINML